MLHIDGASMKFNRWFDQLNKIESSKKFISNFCYFTKQEKLANNAKFFDIAVKNILIQEQQKSFYSDNESFLSLSSQNQLMKIDKVLLNSKGFACLMECMNNYLYENTIDNEMNFLSIFCCEPKNPFCLLSESFKKTSDALKPIINDAKEKAKLDLAHVISFVDQIASACVNDQENSSDYSVFWKIYNRVQSLFWNINDMIDPLAPKEEKYRNIFASIPEIYKQNNKEIEEAGRLFMNIYNFIKSLLQGNSKRLGIMHVYSYYYGLFMDSDGFPEESWKDLVHWPNYNTEEKKQYAEKALLDIITQMKKKKIIESFAV